jgi:phage gp45-like
MSAKSKEQLELHAEEATDETTEQRQTGDRREVYLREGRTLSIEDVGADELVEIRSSSGQIELRIRLTEEGPVLHMESARLQLKATESVEIASKRVEITATESLQLKSENEIKADAEGEVRVNGKMIYLN